MFKIALNNIYLTRGDTVKFEIGLAEIPGVSEGYTLSDKDRVYFIVTHNPHIVDIEDLDHHGSCIFYKTGTVITLNPEDTKILSEDHYYYHVRVILADTEDIHTIIEPHDFILTPDREEWW